MRQLWTFKKTLSLSLSRSLSLRILLEMWAKKTFYRPFVSALKSQCSDVCPFTNALWVGYRTQIQLSGGRAVLSHDVGPPSIFHNSASNSFQPKTNAWRCQLSMARYQCCLEHIVVHWRRMRINLLSYKFTPLFPFLRSNDCRADSDVQRNVSWISQKEHTTDFINLSG